MFGISLPSVSDVTNAVKNTVSSGVSEAESLGAAAVGKASDLGRGAVDLGRKAVDTVSKIDVQKIGATVNGAIDKAQTAAEGGIRKGVMWTGKEIHAGADFARSRIHGDSLLAKGARAAITDVETQTRFDVGAVGGVADAAVGLVGSAGKLGVLATEYQYSPSARAAINAKVEGAVVGGAKSVADYASSVAKDPSRVVGDAKGALNAGKDFVVGKYDEAKTAIAEGHGPESFGMVAGNAATYFIPIAGEARLAGTGVEIAGRGATTLLAEDGTRALAETGTRALAEDGTRAVITDGTKAGTEAAAKDGAKVASEDAAKVKPPEVKPPEPPPPPPVISDVARAAVPDVAKRTGLSEAKVTEILETPKSLRELPQDYLSKGYIDQHLAQWDEGAVRFTSRAKFAEKETLGPPGGFTIPASQFKEVLKTSGGDLTKIEDQLGLVRGTLKDSDTMIVRIAPENMDNLRMPSGREFGANENWIPGGYTSGGQPEAAMDFPKGLPYTEINIGTR